MDNLPPPNVLQNFLAVMQATQNQVRFEVTYPNHCKGVQLTEKMVHPETVELKAIEIFRRERPDYRVQNMATALLTKRAIEELFSQINNDEVTLTNGCCTLKTCPTTKFLECVLKAVATQ